VGLRRVVAANERVLALQRAGATEAARVALEQELAETSDRLRAGTSAALAFNAEMAGRLSRASSIIRHRALWAGYILDFIVLVLALLGAWLLRRQARARHALQTAQTRAVEQRSAELEQFAGRVAHDIKNPMSAAHTGIQVLARKYQDPGVQQVTQRVLGSLQRANAILDALLDFARSGAQPDPGARTDVRATLEDILPAMRPDAQAQGITLTVHALPAVRVACSPGVYLSLVGNLVRNAIKYMGDSAERRIDVRVRRVGDLVRTEVADTGPGIPPAHAQALFEPYFRLSPARAGGLGLGLATVKRLVEGHHGEVGVDSRPGGGSTFWFSLPAAGVTSPDQELAPGAGEQEAGLH
jgi:signal transduction histidine kinase